MRRAPPWLCIIACIVDAAVRGIKRVLLQVLSREGDTRCCKYSRMLDKRCCGGNARRRSAMVCCAVTATCLHRCCYRCLSAGIPHCCTDTDWSASQRGAFCVAATPLTPQFGWLLCPVGRREMLGLLMWRSCTQLHVLFCAFIGTPVSCLLGFIHQQPCSWSLAVWLLYM